MERYKVNINGPDDRLELNSIEDASFPISGDTRTIVLEYCDYSLLHISVQFGVDPGRDVSLHGSEIRITYTGKAASEIANSL